MSAPSFTTSKSMLLHAALAYISPEVTTLNHIIQRGHTPIPAPSALAASNSSVRRERHPSLVPRLPIEILLLIREWLVPEVIAARQIQSRNALIAYEHTLRQLLCDDCVLYNLDIYGPNIWDWEQFTSACSCREPGVPQGFRSSSSPSERRARNARLRDRQRSMSVSASETSTEVDPKQFLDAEHWLEGHLSREMASCIGNRGHGASSPTYSSTNAIFDSASEATRTTCTAPEFDVDIWKVVASVLRAFDCEAVHEADSGTSAYQRAARRQQLRNPSHNNVEIMPLGVRNDLQSMDSRQLDFAHEWDMQRRLHLVYRELGLWSDHPDIFFDYLLQLSVPITHQQDDCEQTGSSSYFKRRDLVRINDSVHLLQTLFYVSFSVATGLVSAPLTLTTFALTLLCYYSRPKVFRLL